MEGVEFGDLVSKFVNRLSAVIVIGAERETVMAALAKNAPNVPVVEIANQEEVMHQVVKAAKSLAKPGDVVLLAPAAASMDQFKDYADRGKQFAEQVKIQAEQI